MELTKEQKERNDIYFEELARKLKFTKEQSRHISDVIFFIADKNLSSVDIAALLIGINHQYLSSLLDLAKKNESSE